MAYSEGQLNGAADYRCGINIWRTGSSQPGNYSTYYWEVTLVSFGGAWSGSTQYWSASVGGQGRSGTFVMTQAQASVHIRVIGNGYVDVGHDAAGYRPGFANNAYIDTNHSNVGDGGSGDAWVDGPRISKTPAAPTPVGLDQITDSSMRYQFSGNDLAGGNLHHWEFEYGKNSSFAPGTYISVASSGTSTVNNLEPGTRYYYRSRAVTTSSIDGSLIYGYWSTTISAETLAGVYVSDGVNWLAAGLKVSDGAAWASDVPAISDGDSWEAPITL